MKAINRIKKSEDFALAINKGNLFRLPSYIVYVRNTDLNYARVGISASKKLGHAVTRNRAKRQVRAICDSLIKYDKHSLDVVIIIKNKFLETVFDDNKSQLCDLFEKHLGA